MAVGEEDIMGTEMDGTMEAGEVEVAIGAGAGNERFSLIPTKSANHRHLTSSREELGSKISPHDLNGQCPSKSTSAKRLKFPAMICTAA